MVRAGRGKTQSVIAASNRLMGPCRRSRALRRSLCASRCQPGRKGRNCRQIRQSSGWEQHGIGFEGQGRAGDRGEPRHRPGIAMSFAAEGCDLMLTGRDEAALEEIAAEVDQKGPEGRDLGARPSQARLREAAGRGGAARVRPARYPRQQCRRDQARRLLQADRRRLAGRICAEVFRPYAAGARGLAAAEGAKGSFVSIAGIGGKEPEAEFTIGSSVNAAGVAFTKAWRTSARPTACRSTGSIPAASRPNGNGSGSARRMQATGESEPRCARISAEDRLHPVRQACEDLGSLIAFLVSPRGPGCTAPRSTSTAAKCVQCEHVVAPCDPGAAQHEAISRLRVS